MMSQNIIVAQQLVKQVRNYEEKAREDEMIVRNKKTRTNRSDYMHFGTVLGKRLKGISVLYYKYKCFVLYDLC